MLPPTAKYRHWLAVSIACLPLVAFVVIAWRTCVNIPNMDDYDAIFRFLDVYGSHPNWQSKAWWILISQHNEYKLMFLHTIVGAEYSFTHQVNFVFLSWCGNLFLPLLAGVLWLLFGRLDRPWHERVCLFIPVSFLMFSLQFWETVNWAMAGLQNLAVLPFSLLSLLLLEKRRKPYSLSAAFILLILAIAASASGFSAALAGGLMLASQRRWRALLGWLSVAGIMASLYFTHYTVNTSAPPPSPPLRSVAFGVASYFSFLGSALDNFWLSLAAGIALTVLFLFLAVKYRHRLDRVGFSFAIFVLITAAMVAKGRYWIGLNAGIASRYRIYSLLFVSVLYFMLLRIYSPAAIFQRTRWRQLFIGSCALTAIYFVATDYQALRSMTHRKQMLVTHFIAWEQHPEQLILVPDENHLLTDPTMIGFRERAQRAMKRAIENHSYQAPAEAHLTRESVH